MQFSLTSGVFEPTSRHNKPHRQKCDPFRVKGCRKSHDQLYYPATVDTSRANELAIPLTKNKDGVKGSTSCRYTTVEHTTPYNRSVYSCGSVQMSEQRGAQKFTSCAPICGYLRTSAKRHTPLPYTF